MAGIIIWGLVSGRRINVFKDERPKGKLGCLLGGEGEHVGWGWGRGERKQTGIKEKTQQGRECWALQGPVTIPAFTVS